MSSNQKERYTDLIKAEALQLGFSYCGVAKAEFLEDEAPKLEEWLNRDYQGDMSWMENHFDKRLDPRLLFPGAKSVVSLLLNYHTDIKQSDPEAPKISRYAYGRDYHKVIKKKLKKLLNTIREEIGEVGGRAFVDSAPVMDKVWAQRSGLGWMGKHTNLINKEQGSWFFVAELILDVELEYDQPFHTDHCGSCTRCIDACPTDAIVEPYVVDGSKCISYLTIELKDEIPGELQDKMDDWVFGCDVCQDVCPWNRFSLKHQVEDFNPKPELLDMTERDWHDMTEEVFSEVFRGSAVKRTKYEGIRRNLKVIKAHKKGPPNGGPD